MMSERGKNINLFLMDGSFNGRIKCTLANWTGIAYRIPRGYLPLWKERSDLQQSGIYFLFGGPKDGEPTVYIGQAGMRRSGEGILRRLQEHDARPKVDWDEAVVFIVSNNSFGPTEISYLENRFCGIATDAGRYKVTNGNEPTQGNVTEEKKSELEEFIEYAKLIMGVLRHQVFEPASTERVQKTTVLPTSTSDRQDPVVYIITRAGTDARMVRSSAGYILLKGSRIREKDLSAIYPPSTRSLRKRYQEYIGQNMTVLEDLTFDSPTGAAGFVLGLPVNGRQAWKTEDGIPLGDIVPRS